MSTASEIAYREVRGDILGAVFPPGHQLKEVDLAERFGVSRTPVRQALRALADDGLVTVRPNGRTYVSEVNRAQFEETFDVVVMLESHSAGLAAQHIGDADIARLEAIEVERVGVASTDRKADHRVFIDLNSEFHRIIHRASNNDKVMDLVMRVVDFPNNIYTKFGQINSSHNPKSLAQHQQIIEALKARDREWTVLEMRAHAESVRRSYRTLWEENAGLE
ncbi:MAG: GntR family transcriptional regulator [Rhodospirillales bacterium]|jgi:DNA-binding GntR family transcriptional regulator|nr:hypothetical protein [Rhodospirillaceae bacterium]MDP6427215.1 GntR family transcriptional regulator [Rhodospirillales bacterium]MDP6645411.1 GntR family transcriptional regulator [Rhodospirillales bacterium]MDP6841321.1 GntR family transcriptional regulator [Rhodospirillales bacterium]|tara:strand:- start:830 stop:1492 length:663 start_codon:yes stop_codon:yes gene_type:complete